jgi:hypothetical protein
MSPTTALLSFYSASLKLTRESVRGRISDQAFSTVLGVVHNLKILRQYVKYLGVSYFAGTVPRLKPAMCQIHTHLI